MADGDETGTSTDLVWYVDVSDPQHPFGWTEDGVTFAIYRRGLDWFPVMTRRRLWWETRVKSWLQTALVLAGGVGWLAAVGALQNHHHVFYATLLGTGPLLWGWGYVKGKAHGPS